MKKRGRPSKNCKKGFRIGIRLGESEWKMLKFLEAVTGKSRTSILVDGLHMLYNLEKVKQDN